jgi:transcriptional regulator with XRE-family HTH domain
MDFPEALRRTMFEYNLTAAELGRAAEVNPNQISQFQNGKRDLRSSNLYKVLEALPDEARHYCLELAFPTTRHCA